MEGKSHGNPMPASTLQTAQRRFLFLQGPHGPFFSQLAKMLTAAGAEVWRVGFNAGDAFFWHDPTHFIPFQDSPENWEAALTKIVNDHGITDIALYGDTRPIHAQAVALARSKSLEVHVFEEGYMRPYWVTYERGGSNGHSRLMDMSVSEMKNALEQSDMDTALPPARWGDMRQHVFYGALYHWFVMFRNGAYRGFRPHRDVPVSKEFNLHLHRLIMMPLHALERRIATRRVRNGGFPYHLALLQLEHDASFRMHSSFSSMTEFLDVVMRGFSEGAPKHHHLVFKAHPLEDGRVPLAREIKRLAEEMGVRERVHFLRGGKLAELLNHARTAVTVNSTAGQQVLWRGIPLKVFGAAVYAKPEFVSEQPLAEFFAHPSRPYRKAYGEYRRYLMETSQVAGGFYSARGRRELMRQVVDMMLAPEDPYDALAKGTAPPRQQLRSVK
jgi:capsular polysaccharide export protein